MSPSRAFASANVPAARVKRLRRVGLLAALLLAFVAVLPELLSAGKPGLGPLQISVLMFALVPLTMAGLGRVHGRVLLLIATVATTLSGAIFVLSIAQFDVAGLAWRLKERVVGPQRLKIFEVHDRYGWRNEPLTRDRHSHIDYDVEYSIDAAGNRPTASVDANAAERPSVLGLGGSFTFGQGVNDLEAWPARLAGKLSVRVINAGVNGWGTKQCALRLQDELQAESLPDRVIYAWIPAHIHRNLNRRWWLEALADSHRQLPSVRWNGEVPEFDHLLTLAEAADDSTELRQQEIAESAKLINAMAKMCSVRNVEFVCVLLPSDPYDEPVTDRMIEQLRDVIVVDLRNLPKTEFFQHDRHPTDVTHRAIADALSKHPALQSRPIP